MITGLREVYLNGGNIRYWAKDNGTTVDSANRKARRIGLKRSKELRKGTISKPSQPVVFTKRRCLGGCGKFFESEWEGNRICRRCKDRQRWNNGSDWMGGVPTRYRRGAAGVE